MQNHLKQKIALCIITSAADKEKALNLGASLSSYVDKIVITGPEEFKWVDDFSAARTFNFSQTDADWILWLDADDTLENPEKLRELVEEAEANNISGYWVLYKYGFDKNGNCVDEHWKEQLVKNDGSFVWRGPIHETLCQEKQVNLLMTNKITRVHHTTEERGQESFARNLRILEKWHKDEPTEPRAMFYLGRTYIAAGEFQKAIDVLQEHLELSGWDDERYEARLLIGRGFDALGDSDSALLAYNDAILEKEKNPDAYIYKAYIYIQKEKYDYALSNLKHALELPVPQAVTYFNPMFYSRDVYHAIGIAYMHLGKLEDSQTALSMAYKADAKYLPVKELLGAVTMLKEKQGAVTRIVELAKFYEKHDSKKIVPFLNSIPSSLYDNEVICALRKKFVPPVKWKEKSIAVFCGTSAENWTPDSQNTGGIGGSETAVAELTKRLVKQGWDVTVYNQGGHLPEGQDFDGVHYKNYWLFNPDDTFDVLWVWRVPELFDYNVKGRVRILDLHDVMNPNDFPQSRLDKIDKIFVKTNYHRSLLPAIPDEKFTIINNGIDLDRFEGPHNNKDPWRFCYTSSPNRGLDVLLEMWPKIRAALPEATLHVYYGWNTYYQIEKNNPERMIWMKRMQKMMEQPGVINHGRLGQKELAEDLLKTSFWLYPTYFPEISCITAMEMQAAGVIPMTSGYAALEETQGRVGLKLPGDVYDPEWQEKYLTRVISHAKYGPELKEHFQKSRDFLIEELRKQSKEFNWDNVAVKWNKELI